MHRVPPHIHETYEITYVASGRGDWVVEGNRVALQKDDFYIVQPGELHSGGADRADPYHIFVIGLEPSALPLLKGMLPDGHNNALPPAHSVPLQRSSVKERILTRKRQGVIVMDAPLQSLPDACPPEDVATLDALQQRVISGASGGTGIFRRLLNELDTPCGTDGRARALRLLAVQAILVELLVFVARCHAAASAGRQVPRACDNTRPEIADVKAWLHSRLTDPPTLGEMARRSNLSLSHFAEVFKRETGTTPLDYITSARIEEAARRLRERPEESVTRIAAELGFGSSQYFSTVFRRHVGYTPREWQKHRPGLYRTA
jgi:AraC-like DNA-binding protein